MKKLRKHIYFSGMVQGVGFRYRAINAARRHGLTGWVKNLADGRVEMEVQGEEDSVDLMISQLGEGNFIRVSGIEITEKQLIERESSFRIIG